MIYLKSIALRITFIVAISVANFGYAWTKQGHEWLGQQGYLNLTRGERAYYDGLAAALNVGDGGLAAMSSFPDKIRKKTLSELFSQYDLSVPERFQEVQRYTTGRWHYHNTPYKKPPECEFKNKGELLLRLNDVNAMLQTSMSPTQEALLLSFALHLIQDLHQPLHAMAYVDKQCDHDRGGNLICIKKNKVGFCELNLHALWDRGFGVFEQTHFSMPDRLPEYSFDPASWLQESFQYASTVYALRDSDYDTTARSVINQRVNLTILRTVEFLKLHYKRRRKN